VNEAHLSILGDDVVELGPGPGLTTDLLVQHVRQVTAVEVDSALADSLAARVGTSQATVLHADATDTGLEAGRFSAVVCFSMLHHVPSPSLQDSVFREASRILRPGGRFLGVDSLDMEEIRAFHIDDVFVPLALDTLGDRLARAGFTNVSIESTERQIRFVAIKE
jgi:SAM-dependent methyltransferase